MYFSLFIKVRPKLYNTKVLIGDATKKRASNTSLFFSEGMQTFLCVKTLFGKIVHSIFFKRKLYFIVTIRC